MKIKAFKNPFIHHPGDNLKLDKFSFMSGVPAWRQINPKFIMWFEVKVNGVSAITLLKKEQKDFRDDVSQHFYKCLVVPKNKEEGSFTCFIGKCWFVPKVKMLFKSCLPKALDFNSNSFIVADAITSYYISREIQQRQ